MAEPAATASDDLAGWTPRARPPRNAIEGRYCRVEPFDVGPHAKSLFDALAADGEGALWRFLPYGPFPDLLSYVSHARRSMTGADPLFHAVVDLDSGRAAGVAALMRIVPEHGVIEIGHICFSPALQRTRQATEAIYLLLRRAFDELGYRRCEWKCDAANFASQRAAERFGFRYEGLFRKHMVLKDVNRDTVWFSITDDEWPALRAAFERWLDPGNFDEAGRQRLPLADFRNERESNA